jgi:hypothetical protein
MFDAIGRADDPSTWSRRGQAAVLTALLFGVWIGILARFWGEREYVPPALVGGELVHLEPPEEPDIQLPEQLPSLPEPVDTGTDTGAQVDTGAPGDPAPTADPEAEPAALGEIGAAPVADAAATVDGAHGDGTGHGDGADARPATPPQPRVEVRLDSGPVQHLAVRRRRRPLYPPIAARMDLPAVTCVLRVYVDGDGEARHVEYPNCPDLFQTHARATVFAWQWEPFPTFDPTPTGWKPVEVTLVFEK